MKIRTRDLPRPARLALTMTLSRMVEARRRHRSLLYEVGASNPACDVSEAVLEEATESFKAMLATLTTSPPKPAAPPRPEWEREAVARWTAMTTDERIASNARTSQTQTLLSKVQLPLTAATMASLVPGDVWIAVFDHFAARMHQHVPIATFRTTSGGMCMDKVITCLEAAQALSSMAHGMIDGNEEATRRLKKLLRAYASQHNMKLAPSKDEHALAEALQAQSVTAENWGGQDLLLVQLNGDYD